MNYGLVGNTIFFGGAAMMFGYLFWELNEMSKSMAKFDDTHPVNDIYKTENVQRFIKHKNKYSEQEIIRISNKNPKDLIPKIINDSEADI